MALVKHDNGVETRGCWDKQMKECAAFIFAFRVLSPDPVRGYDRTD